MPLQQSNIDQRRQFDSWALEIVGRGAWKTKMSYDIRSSRVTFLSNRVLFFFFFRRSRMWTVFSGAIFSHHPCRLQAFHVSITFFFMCLSWWAAWELWATWKDQVREMCCTLQELEKQPPNGMCITSRDSPKTLCWCYSYVFIFIYLFLFLWNAV